jgi:hypothetical protein
MKATSNFVCEQALLPTSRTLLRQVGPICEAHAQSAVELSRELRVFSTKRGKEPRTLTAPCANEPDVALTPPPRAYEYGDNRTGFDSRLIISAEIASAAL